MYPDTLSRNPVGGYELAIVLDRVLLVPCDPLVVGQTNEADLTTDYQPNRLRVWLVNLSRR